MKLLRHTLLLCLLLLFGSSLLFAQGRRGPMTMVRGGQIEKPDTTRTDSLVLDSLMADSLLRDTVLLDSLLRDTLPVLLPPARDDLRPKKHRDTLGLSGVAWISTVAPGFGQIYNKQYWKVPILYGVTGAGITMFIRENKKYNLYKREYTALGLEIAAADAIEDRDDRLNVQLPLSEARDRVQTRMIRTNTARQISIGLAAVSYLYFIGDAALNYNRPHASNTRVKKATSLATVLPGAGQIYNKSYWKLPFVVGGLASTIYVVDWNNRGYKRIQAAYKLQVQYERDKKAYAAAEAANPGNPGMEKPVPLDEFRGSYSEDFLRDLRDSYRRSRDLSIIITAAIYLFQIVDAHVDAHLKDYDISDNLAWDIKPSLSYAYAPGGGITPTFGMDFTLRF